MKETFLEHEFSSEKLDTIYFINEILDEYSQQGYRLSLRQLYYQLVARDYIENSIRSYKRIGDLVSNARLAGYIDWEMIEDRGRQTTQNAHWENPGQIVWAAAKQFRTDRWRHQPFYVEVFVEKDALSGILEPVCKELDISFTANKGYSSSSAMYEASRRLIQAFKDGKEITVLYLGDHDPSGIDMTRDIKDRFDLFTYQRMPFDVVRLALNYNQVEEWQPPRNPAKETDSRYREYANRYGESSWELDAVEPSTLADLVKDHVKDLIDTNRWEEDEQMENDMKAKLLRVAKELLEEGDEE
jgi:hypothetical protein